MVNLFCECLVESVTQLCLSWMLSLPVNLSQTYCWRSFISCANGDLRKSYRQETQAIWTSFQCLSCSLSQIILHFAYSEVAVIRNVLVFDACVIPESTTLNQFRLHEKVVGQIDNLYLTPVAKSRKTWVGINSVIGEQNVIFTTVCNS